jgi:hypothetical protein
MQQRSGSRFSSFHRDGAAGIFPEDEAGEFEAVGEFGEPCALATL